MPTAGVGALLYQAGLDAATRARHQDRFLNVDGVVIVPPIAFGMGIDKPDVRFVAHLDLPKSVEGYYQETGRAGRDGLASTAWLSYGLQDAVQQRKLIASSGGGEAHRRRQSQHLDDMLALCATVGCAQVLRRQRAVMLRREPERAAKPPRARKAAEPAATLPAEAAAVFEQLRAWRYERAKEQGVPAYVVFTDATLREIATTLPSSLAELGRVSGIGETKLARYGQQVLDALGA